jgi:hypothetical protein
MQNQPTMSPHRRSQERAREEKGQAIQAYRKDCVVFALRSRKNAFLEKLINHIADD